MDGLITRTTDNAYPSVTVSLSMSEWESTARRFFGWRTRAGYPTWHGRIQSLGSHDYDALIQFAARRA